MESRASWSGRACEGEGGHGEGVRGRESEREGGGVAGEGESVRDGFICY